MNILKKGKGKLATLFALFATVICAFVAAFVIGGNNTQASAATADEDAQISTYAATSLETDWNDAVQESLDDGIQVTFTLTANWTAQADPTYTTSFGSGVGFDNGRLYVPAGANIVLDLKTFNINRGLKGATAIADGGVIYVDGGSLEITGTTGKITGGNTTGNGGGVYLTNSASLAMSGGTIGGTSASDGNVAKNGGGIFAASKSQVSITGGQINYNTASYGGGIYSNGSSMVTLQNCTIDNNASNGGGGINSSSATLTINSGTVITNNSGSLDGKDHGGGGINAYNGKFVMNGGTISDNITAWGGAMYLDGTLAELNGGEISDNTSTSYGGGIFTMRNKFTMNGGKISGNTSPEDGGGVCVASATFTMNGGEISGNTATGKSGAYGEGGGIYTYTHGTKLDTPSSLIITGGEIKNNTAGVRGGGIFSNNSIQIGGACNIEGNKQGSTNSNVWLVSQKISISGALTGAKIGVTMATNGIFTAGYSSYNSGIDPSMFFFSDAGKKVELSSNEAAIGTASAPAAPTKSLIWQYRVSGGTWANAPSSFAYTGSTYNVRAVIDANNTATIAKTTYKDVNGNQVTAIKNAGTYTFFVNDADYTNPAFTLTITPLDVTVTWGSNDLYYSGNLQTPSFTLNGILDADASNVTAALNTSKVGVNAGNGYSVSIDGLIGAAAVNYKFAAGAKTSQSYNILKATPVVTPDISLDKQLFAGKPLPTITTSTGDTAGTIAWKESTLTAGTKSYNWTFTPTDTVNYNTVKGTYILTADEVVPASISATFNAGANTIYTGTTFAQLKSYITLTCTNNDGTDSTVTDYGLFGELTVGTSTLTITYSGLSTTVDIPNVLGVGEVTLSNLKAAFTAGAQKDYVAFDKFNPAGVTVTAVYSDNSEKVVANYTFDYMDPTKDYLCANDAYVTFKYSEGGQNVTCRLSGLTVTKAKPTVNPQISLNKQLIAGENLPAIALSTGDTDGNIAWTVATLSEGIKSYTWTFTPTGTDALNYETATGSYILAAEKKALTSITATYTPDEDFKVTTVTTLDEIRDYVSVEGAYNDGTKGTINNFEIFGTLKAGKSVITVTYGGASTTFEIADVEAVKESSKVTPKLTVSGLLIEGNALPAIALSAGDTAGTISWDKVDGDTAKLVAGANAYNWTFTPTDTTKYEVVTGSYTFNADPVKVVSLEIKQKSIGSSIYTGTSLDDIKEMITVTATYNNNDKKTLTSEEYDLYATLYVGPSKLVVEYEGVTGSMDITVQSQEGAVNVQVKWMAAEYVYDGKLHIPTPYIEWNNEKILLEAELMDGFDGTSAGTQKVKAVASDKYQILGETVRTYSIEKAEISIVWSSDNGWTYNGEAQNPAAQVKAGFNDGKISVQYRITAKSGSALTDGKAVNAGAYVAEVVLGGAENYSVNGKTTFEFAIAKKKVEKPLALTSEFIYNGAAQTYLPTGFDESLMTIAGGTQTEAGEHVVTVELKDTTNYEWADGTSQKLNFSFNIGALPDAPKTQNSGLDWWIILLIVLVVIAVLLAIIGIIAASRRRESSEDDDGFYDDVTTDDLN